MPLAPVVSRRTLLTRPNGEGIVGDFVHVLEGVARVVVDARLDVFAGLGTEAAFMADKLEPPDLAPTVDKVEALYEKKAALQPFVHYLSRDVRPGDLPGADQLLEAFEVGVGLRCLLFYVGTSVCHVELPFFSTTFHVVFEHRLRVAMSSLTGLVGGKNHTRSGRFGIDEFQPLQLTAVFEEVLALAHDHRMNREGKLVEKVVL